MKCSLLTLSLYLDGEVDARRRGEIEGHLCACARCRVGLDNLRDDAGHLRSLAMVMVPDSAARVLMEQTSVLDSDEPMPPRTDPATAIVVASDDPPLFVNAAAAALRDSFEEAPDPLVAEDAPPRPSLPDAAVTSAVVPARWSPAGTAAAATTAVAPSETAAAPASGGGVATAVTTDEHVPVGDPSPRYALSPAPAALVAAGGDVPSHHHPAHRPTPFTEPIEAASVPRTVDAPPPPGLDGDRLSPPLGAMPISDATIAHLPVDDGAEATEEGPHPLDGGGTGGVVSDRPAGIAPSDVIETIDPVGPSLDHSEGDDGGAGESTAFPRATEPISANLFDGGIDVSTPPRSSQPPNPVTYPLTDDDTLAEPTPVDRYVGGPIPAPKAGIFSRLRDRMALQRSLAAADVEMSSIEVGEAAEPVTPAPPSRPGRWRRAPGRPWVPMESDDRRQDDEETPLWQLGKYTPLPGEPGGGGGHDAAPQGASVAEIANPANREFAPVSLGASRGDQADDEEDGASGRGWQSSAATRRDVVAARHAPPRRGLLGVGIDGRFLAVGGAALALLFVVGVISGRTETPLAGAPARASVSSQSSTPAGGSSASAVPNLRGQTGPTPTAAPTPRPVATGTLSNVQTIGAGGTGWQLQGLRSASHAGFYRMVFDLGGGTGGAPTVTVGFLDPTTMVIAVAGATSSLPASVSADGRVVTSITKLENSPVAGAVAYRIQLARAARVTAGLLSSPTRLVVDLT